MSTQVDIQADIEVGPELHSLMRTAVKTTLSQQMQLDECIVSIWLTDDAHIQQLNRDYLGYDKPTDVLSFPAGDEMPGMHEELDYLGDIAISVPYATRQAERAGHDLAAEIQLLTVHGVLHLLGHDHADPHEKETMWAAQTAVLTLLGLDDITPTES